jgi:DUF971 family protein
MSATLRSLKRVGDAIEFTWDDDLCVSLQPATLRRACPCAECVSELTGEAILDPTSVADDLAILDMQPVGHYAYRLLFSDQHDSGLFRLEYLRKIGSTSQP